MEFMTASGRLVPIEIKRRKGTRHLKLSLGYQNQIVASTPWHCSERSVLKFVEKQRDWLEVQLESAPRACTLFEWFDTPSAFVSASGEQLTVRIIAKQSGRSDYSFDEGGAVVLFRLREKTEAELRRIVRSFAKDALTCRTFFHAKRLELEFASLTVRDQASRWGSCSARRGISLNWRLILLPVELQDYVILHELAHLSEMNHSARFWALLDQYDAKRLEHEAQLSSISSRYMRISRI